MGCKTPALAFALALAAGFPVPAFPAPALSTALTPAASSALYALTALSSASAGDDAMRLAAWDDPVSSARDSAPGAAPAPSADGADTLDAFAPQPDTGGGPGTRASVPPAAGADADLADLDTGAVVILLPMSAARGTDPLELALVEAGLRLGLAESGRFRILAREQEELAWPGGRLPGACFAARCAARAAAEAPSPLVLASDFSSRDGRWTLRLALVHAPEGRLRRALQVWAASGPGGNAAFAREAGLRLAAPDARTPALEGALYASGPWRSIAWLNPRDTADLRTRAGWGGAALLAAGAALAFAEGQLTGADGNASAPARALRPASGAYSYLRGFFAAPPLGARYAAMGGAGLAAVDDGLALLMNPAGAAGAGREDAIMAKRSLPDGTPSFFVAYAGPLYRGWHHGLGARYEGDRLANETTLYGTLACDLGRDFGPAWEGVKAGASGKIYLAQAGEGGTGLDRSTGHSYGMGLDLGVQAPLGDQLTAAFSVRDAFGFLRHRNTFTDRDYGEILPAEWKIGAAYRAQRGLTLLLDGQKAVWADQTDHVRVGGEQILWDFLALRGGLHEAFGRETVRAIALGFGLDTGGLGERLLKEGAPKLRLALDYAYEFGLEADAPLAGGQQFSLKLGF